MIIDLPPQVEQVIIEQAQSKGMTAESYLIECLTDLAITYSGNGFSDVENDGITTNQSPQLAYDDLQAIHEHLDEPPNPTPAMTALMAKYGGLNV